MAISGSALYDKIKPIIDEQIITPIDFLTKVGNAISNYIVTNDSLAGAYAGTIPGTPPVPSTLLVATACMVPQGQILPTPLKTETWKPWLKRSLMLPNVTWSISPFGPTHSFTPVQMNPIYGVTEAYFETLGGLEDVRSAYGIWALLSDLIVLCILSAVERITPVSATGVDGSNGIITWVPLDIPELKHNFIIKIKYDATNLKLVQWLEEKGIDTSDLEGEVSIPLDNQLYQTALASWKAIKAITKDCTFYKKQDSGEEIFLVNGYQI